jgi:hypothetical protein
MKRAADAVEKELKKNHATRSKKGRVEAVPSPPLPLDPALALADVALPMEVLFAHVLPRCDMRTLHKSATMCKYVEREWPVVVVDIKDRMFGTGRLPAFFVRGVPRMRNVKSIMDYDRVTYYLQHLPAAAPVTSIETRGFTYFCDWQWPIAQRLPNLTRLDLWFDAPTERRPVEFFTGLTALRDLHIRQDRDTIDGDRLITQLGGMPLLTKLVIDQHMRTTDAALQYLTGLRELKIVYECAFTDAGLVARASTLTRLVLVGSGWKFTPSGIGALTNLRSLKIDSYEWHPMGLADAIAQLTNLRTLVLDHPSAFIPGGIPYSFLSPLAANLETLELGYDFPEHAVTWVATLTRLTELRLVDYGYQDMEASKLKTKLLPINALIKQAPPSVLSLFLAGAAAKLARKSSILALTQLRSLKFGRYFGAEKHFGTYEELVKALPRLTVYSTDKY